MAYIEMTDIGKKYGEYQAVSGLTLGIEKGSFVTLLGPSGCGKTTTLRMIAGLIRPTRGEISVEGKILSSGSIFVPPEERKMGMVFQSYAVWPHMSVFGNIAYPLKKQKKSNAEIVRRVRDVIELVKLTDFEKRMPHELSGGQQQRVALARALVMQPVALLLDEPLSNLDAKLRKEMQYEIKEIQNRSGITVVYVTHDLSEAMSMSDMIVVMENGKAMQVGGPREIYFKPANKSVATFIGRSNFLNGTIQMVNGAKTLVGLSGISQEFADLEGFKAESAVTVAVKAEDVVITPSLAGEYRVESVSFAGDHIDYRIACQEQRLTSLQPTSLDLSVGERVDVRFAKYSLFE